MNSRNNINDDIRQMHDQTRSRIAKLKQYRDTVKYNAELFISRTNQLLSHLDNAIKIEETALQPLVDSAHGRQSELTKEEKDIINQANQKMEDNLEEKSKEANGKKPTGKVVVDEKGNEYIDITSDDHE